MARRTWLLLACVAGWLSWRPSPARVGGGGAAQGGGAASGRGGGTAAASGRFTVSPEDIADQVRTRAASVRRLAAYRALPLRKWLVQLEGAALSRLGGKLAQVAEAAPPAATASLAAVCRALQVEGPCPRLFVLRSERGLQLEALPLDAEGRLFGIFASGGLVEAAEPRLFAALLAREVALVKMLRVHVPGLWALRQALTPASVPSQPAVVGTAGAQWSLLGEGVLAESAQGLSRQLVQLCRAHRGVGLIDDLADELPQELAWAWGTASSTYRHAVPPWLGHLADFIAVAHDGTPQEALLAAAGKARVAAEEAHLGTLLRIGKLCKEVAPKQGWDLSPRGLLRGARRLRWTYQVGPDLVENLLSLASRARQPQTWFRAAPKRRAVRRRGFLAALPWRSALLAAATVRRIAELAADREAACAVGSPEPVIAGLVLLHGSPEERRRLARGELQGLLADARAEEARSQRWRTWWTSAVQVRWRPPLRLRVAELAAWAEGAEGRRQLAACVAAESSTRPWFLRAPLWFLRVPGRVWHALPR